MPRARSTFAVKMHGNFMGVKVNVTGPSFRRNYAELSRIMQTSSSAMLKELMPLFERRLKDRIPKLIEQLQRGVQGLRGTEYFENTPHGSHRPHRQIPNPLSLIVERGSSYKVLRTNDRLRVDIRPHATRRKEINFHKDMSSVPRISTVWNRLDATCLPYVKDGHRDAIVERWLENSGISLQSEFMKYMSDRRAALRST